jgi:hypothetical protein
MSEAQTPFIPPQAGIQSHTQGSHTSPWVPARAGTNGYIGRRQ